MTIGEKAIRLIELCKEQGLFVSTAESCTGGLISAAITDVAGSSAVFDRAFVTYSNEAKAQMLGVPIEHTVSPGAVSDLVAREMVDGALENSRADIAVAVTGIAGPGGGSDEKPVGLVYVAVKARDGIPKVLECRFADQGHHSRSDIRAATVNTALAELIALAGSIEG